MIQIKKEEIEFAERAARCFEENPKYRTYTDTGRVEEDELFAVKWGLDNDCILIFTVKDTPKLFAQMIEGGKNAL